MPDLVVTCRRAMEAVQIGHVAHGATWEGEGSRTIYVWCFDHVAPFLFDAKPEGSPIQCLRCLAYGPIGEWQPVPGTHSARSRWESREGERVIIYDTETR